ncbi:MAG: helix-turn-helix domain-containing protein [Chitinophaga sp.]|uniref:helix-turn-helix domain-containing protein n=1 Tax=Chitinophaga sp. TaxID=1869181 RepID=UPI0025C0615D|nr:helix-turn-helix domain-containing protein [Chitinophaga sp.]MBV8255447.1 helix-turn-helix domain-containing protein [Chitinophaga sp.]
METILNKTTKHDQKIAKANRAQVTKASAEIAKTDSDTVALHLEGFKSTLKIPKSAMLLLFDMLDKMADGSSISLLFSDDKSEISTQQAAELLGTSRPYIVSLLEKGEIPFTKIGTHRRIQMKDLIAYNQKIKKNRAHKLDFLTEQAQDLKMGY